MCPECRDRRFMVRAILFAHMVGAAAYLFVRLHSLGVI